jgi:hypothetical protein
MADESVMGSLNASLAKKMAEKYDPTLELNIRSWLAEILEKPEFTDQANNLQELLKDGVLLCE